MKTEKIVCRPETFGGKTHPDSSYYKLREEIRSKTINQIKRIEKGEVDVMIRIYLLRSRAEKSDLDNYLKAIIDGICDFKNKWTKGELRGVIKNESQIGSIFIKRIKVDLIKEEGVKIEINPVR